MLPTAIETETVTNDFEIKTPESLPTKTYWMHLNSNRVAFHTDGKEAMKQAIFKILQTERYQYDKIYSSNYGVEFIDLYGMPVDICEVRIQTRIREALLWDERITNVSGFSFERQRGKLLVKFTAYTIFGSIEIDGVEVRV